MLALTLGCAALRLQIFSWLQLRDVSRLMAVCREWEVPARSALARSLAHGACGQSTLRTLRSDRAFLKDCARQGFDERCDGWGRLAVQRSQSF